MAPKQDPKPKFQEGGQRHRGGKRVDGRLEGGGIVVVVAAAAGVARQ